MGPRTVCNWRARLRKARLGPRRKELKASSGPVSDVNLEQFVDIELSTALTFLVVARDNRCTGNATGANNGELKAHRAYQEALYLFRVLRPNICRSGARRLASRIKKIGNAIHELAHVPYHDEGPAPLALSNPQ